MPTVHVRVLTRVPGAPRVTAATRPKLAVIGAGRVGAALARAFRAAGYTVDGPGARGADGAGADVVLLAVPDAAIAEAAAHVTPGPLVGHLSGATGLHVLEPHERFSLHPLTTIIHRGSAETERAEPMEASSPFVGVAAAIAGSTAHAHREAEHLARALGMTPITVDDRDRPAYHAAASLASNQLVTLLDVAEQLASTAGVHRSALVPLVTAAVHHWAELGPERALTGPIARGDEATVTRQRDAVVERMPEQRELFDALVAATRQLAARQPAAKLSGQTLSTETEQRR